MAQPRPFILLGASDSTHVADHVTGCLRQWCQQWLAGVAPVARAASSDAASGLRWLIAETSDLYAISIGVPDDWLRRAGYLFGGQSEEGSDATPISELTRTVCDAALEALARSLCGAECTVTRGDEPAADLRSAPGSGFVVLDYELGSGGVPLQIVAWPGWVAARLREIARDHREDAALVRPANALAAERVRVNAIVGEAELPFEEVHKLGVGDVLIVDRRVEQPLIMRVEGGDAFAFGHLGTAKGKKAVELMPLTE